METTNVILTRTQPSYFSFYSKHYYKKMGVTDHRLKRFHTRNAPVSCRNLISHRITLLLSLHRTSVGLVSADHNI